MKSYRTFAFLFCFCVEIGAPALKADTFGFFPYWQRSGVQGVTATWRFQALEEYPRPIRLVLAPLTATIDIYSTRTGRIVATATSDSGGRFKVRLPPGEYRLVPRTIYLGPHSGDLAPMVPRYRAAPVLIRISGGCVQECADHLQAQLRRVIRSVRLLTSAATNGSELYF